jgi:hypothetical protein
VRQLLSRLSCMAQSIDLNPQFAGSPGLNNPKGQQDT